MAINLDNNQIREILENEGFIFTSKGREKNGHGDLYNVSKNDINGNITFYDKGSNNIQGKNSKEIKDILATANISLSKTDNSYVNNNNVFVVYGHDITARTELEAMLRRWKLEPIILDQVESNGNTVIEQLFQHIPKASFGVVLATPDDVGYPTGKENELKSRARQNVVLELGMLLSILGRDKVAILLKDTKDMEKPSDINGLIYIPFQNKVEETKVLLAKEMKKQGFNIDISNL